MTEQLITEIQRKMLPYLNNEQIMHLRDAMAETLEGATITYDSGSIPAEETDAVEAFITAKRIEGCSEKTLSYYRKTIESLIAGVGKAVQQVTTDDLRRYLTNYQVQRRSSKVTIDNIRRILSSFFSWLEDEDFIVKSPVRRIHKVKTAKVVKDTYTDEALELMRDNCTTARDLAMVDLLASSGMRVGELVTLNREDINFNERECVVIGKGNKERLVYFDARTKIHLQNYLEGIPWMLAFALRDTGWYLRNDIIWMKDNPMPESVKDRCARCYEHIFLFSKSKKYFFDYKAISEPIAPATAERLKRGMKGGNKYGKPVPGQPQPQSINRPREHGEIKDADINPLRNKRDVWKINTVPFKGGHYAAYPPKLVETCLLAGCPEGGIVLDPFMGSGTTGMVASQMGRHFVGIELNPAYTELAYKRIGGET